MLLSCYLLALCLEIKQVASTPLPLAGMKSPYVYVSDQGEIWIWHYWGDAIQCFDRDGASLPAQDRVFLSGALPSPSLLDWNCRILRLPHTAACQAAPHWPLPLDIPERRRNQKPRHGIGPIGKNHHGTHGNHGRRRRCSKRFTPMSRASREPPKMAGIGWG